MTPRISVLAPLQCSLGEGIHWDARRGLLWLVDIHDQQLIWMDPDLPRFNRRRLPEPVGWVISLANSEGVLVGLKSGMALVNALAPDTPLQWIDRSFPGDQSLRMNDAKVDKFGRVWCGSMSVNGELEDAGSLASYSLTNRAWNVLDGGYSVPNGPAFNQECTVMLHSDSTAGTVYRYNLDPAKNGFNDRIVWRQFSQDEGLPDGMTFDADDCVWIAHWGVGKVCRYDPEGELLLTVQLPVTQVTNVCFGGAAMERIFVTSAKTGLDEGEPHAGDLFEIHNAGVCGFPTWEVSL